MALNEWMNEWMNGLINEWLNEWKHKGMAIYELPALCPHVAVVMLSSPTIYVSLCCFRDSP